MDTTVQFNMMAGAFTGGSGDYVALFEPTATEVEQAGKGVILASIGQTAGEIPYTAYFAGQTFLKENEKLVQGFTNAIAKGQRFVQEAAAEEVAKAIVDFFPDTSVETLTTVVERYRAIDAWNSTPVMEEQALLRLETVMEQAGELAEEDFVVFAELVDNHFAEKTVK